MNRTLCLYLFCLISCLLLSQCTSQPEQNTPPPPTPPKPNIYSLVFIDKTVSFDLADDYATKKYQEILKKIIQDNIQQNDDKVEVYFIHENTAQAKVFATKCKVQIGDTTQLNDTDKQRIKSNYLLSLKKEKLKITKKCLQALEAINEQETKKQTDIWATIPIIDKKNAKKKDNTLLKVYFFSDMVESMKGAGKRDFHYRPPNSSDEAIRWASEDVKQFIEAEIEEVEIYYILPFSPLSSTNENNPNVINYWETLFNQLDIEEFTEISLEE